ncbi:hypothetical protein IJI69_04930 [Candidatus Saccharibacteria bacterium]|nr:hypothetical protein [Candidatus Saccharibacteria bacterium]
MIAKRFSKNRLVRAIFGCLFGMMGLVAGAAPMMVTAPVYADPVETETAEATEETVSISDELVRETQESGKSCQDSLGAIGWLVCPTTGKISEAVDWLYEKIENILVINPVEMKDGSPIYEVWKYMLGITNIVFIIFCLVMVYSQLTGLGITNYGLKKTLPKLIVAAILVNLSFVICSLAVDASNIIGASLRGVFTSIEEATMGGMTMSGGMKVSEMYSALAGGSALALGAGVIAFETGAIWMLIPTVLGAIVAVVIGLITIALRQAVVALLIMISPLAIIAYMLPNTEQWFKKWRQLLTKMLVFYPMFSLLFGASSLAGFAIIASATDGFGVLLGVAVQIFPLFFSWSLMKMSGTVLGTINSKLSALTARPLAANRSWADSRRELTRQKNLARGDVYSPSLRLVQFLNDRKVAREEETKEHAESARLRGQAYAVMRNYNKDGKYLSKEGEESYDQMIRNIGYQRTIDRHKHTFNGGVGDLGANEAQTKRLKALDDKIIRESDRAKMEGTRGELIEARNAESFYRRMEDAMNAHSDDEYGYVIDAETGERVRRKDYKFHFDGEKAKDLDGAIARYMDAKAILGKRPEDIQFAAAGAAQAYDTQKKILEAKMQKYFELLPPTRDVEYRLGELTMQKNASAIIDSIIPGLRILNQRGDTDLLKFQLDNLLEKELGGGIELGTHASQALASFLMFEVKDNDPFLRRFGKYINLETARAYNKNDRKVMDVTYDEYIRGYHDGETDLISEANPTGRMYAKKDMKKLVEGTSLDNIERTALSNLDESLKKAYGFKKGAKSDEWDLDGYLRKREEIQTAFEPAFLSASLKWLSGSEQINSGVKFWTGYDLKQQTEEVEIDGKKVKRVKTDKNGDPEYELSPVWGDEENGFAGREKYVEEYFRRKTYDYFKDQTTGQVLGMRTDYRDPTVEHLVQMYLNDNSEDETSAERQEWYANAEAEIQGRYGDENIEVANRKRSDDMKKLKREVAGRQLRKILDKTGKLEQIYNTRRSGASNNAKDWLRQMLNLDDKDEIYRYLDQKEQELKKKKEGSRQEGQKDGSAGGAPSGVGSPYNDASFRLRVMTTLNKEFEKSGDRPDPDASFYEESLDIIKHEFGTVGGIVEQYEKFKEDNAYAGRSELWEKLEEILGNFFAEQMNQDEEE